MFSRKDLQDALFNAILNGSDVPDRAFAAEFKRKRFNRCARALLSRNLLIPIVVKPGVESVKDIVTGYSEPLETDVMVWGFTWSEPTPEPAKFNGRDLKLSINGHDLIDNVAVSMDTLSGPLSGGFGNQQSGYGTSELPVPIFVPAGGRVVAQLSYNPSSGWTNPMNTSQYDSIILLCLAVNTCLSDEDRLLLERCRAWIETHEYQVPVFLNSVTPPADSNLNINWGATGGGIDVATTSETRPISAPLLVRGFGTNLVLSRFNFRDTRGHEFCPSGLMLAQNFSSAGGLFVSASSYFRFIMPHVLAPGAQLAADHLDGTGANIGASEFDGEVPAPADGVPDQNWLIYPCVTP